MERVGTIWLGWAAAATGALAVTAVVGLRDTTGAEAEAIRAVQTWPLPERAADAVRAVTGTTFVLVFGAALAVVLLRTGARREALALTALLIALGPAQSGLKQALDRPRPDPELLRAAFTSPSFPAGHVMGPTVVYGFLLWLGLRGGRSGAWRTPAIGWSIAVLAATGPANVYLGVHWPTDVLGGYLWGLVLLLPALAVCEKGRGGGAVRGG